LMGLDNNMYDAKVRYLFKLNNKTHV
jgi:hypothetical protein